MTGVTVTGGCELGRTGDTGWLGDELADAGEVTIVDGGTAEVLGTAEVEGVDETAEVEGVDETAEVEGVDEMAEMAGAVDVDGLGGAKRAVKSKGPRAG